MELWNNGAVAGARPLWLPFWVLNSMFLPARAHGVWQAQEGSQLVSPSFPTREQKTQPQCFLHLKCEVNTSRQRHLPRSTHVLMKSVIKSGGFLLLKIAFNWDEIHCSSWDGNLPKDSEKLSRMLLKREKLKDLAVDYLPDRTAENPA